MESEVVGMAKKRKLMNEFRRINRKDGRDHPAYIYAKEGDKFVYLGLTHAEVTKGVKNIRLEQNPNPKDERPSYVRPASQKAKKSTFGAKLKGWFFGKSDQEKVDKLKK